MSKHRPPVGRVPPPGKTVGHAASGDAAYKPKAQRRIGRVPSPGIPVPTPFEPPPRRLRRLERVWPDRNGNISYLLTPCVDGRGRVLNNEETFQRFVEFLLDSPKRYGWFGRRFVIMPDHIHVIAHQGNGAIRLGLWIKAMKAVVSGLERRDAEDVGRVPSPGETEGTSGTAASGDAAYNTKTLRQHVGRVPPHGETFEPSGNAAPGDAACNTKTLREHVGRVPSPGTPVSGTAHEFTRIQRPWRWQAGFHDHKFRTPESESKKWEYVCMNPVRYGLVRRPEEWPFGGEIFYEDADGPRLVRGTPPLLEQRILRDEETPRDTFAL